VVVGAEIYGITGHVRGVCERLADMGYVALAPDVHHRTAPWVELAEDEPGLARGFELLHQLTREDALRDVGAAIDYLRITGSELHDRRDTFDPSVAEDAWARIRALFADELVRTSAEPPLRRAAAYRSYRRCLGPNPIRLGGDQVGTYARSHVNRHRLATRA
jgi:dienelactone hydrolase